MGREEEGQGEGEGEGEFQVGDMKRDKWERWRDARKR